MSDTWTLIDGYTATDYSDTLVFDVDSSTKELEQISGQTLVAGEDSSQYIRIQMDRYWDGIDISAKTIQIVYALAGEYYGTSDAVSAESTDDAIQFGWIVPAEACCVQGTLLFCVVVTDTDYVLKTRVAETTVYKTISESDVVPEPTSVAWYEAFQTRIDALLDTADSTLSSAMSYAESAETSAQTASSTASDIVSDALYPVTTIIGDTEMGTNATTITGAIAEHESDISTINDTIGTDEMGTTATTITGAIAENVGNISNNATDISTINGIIGDSEMGTTAETITGAIAEHESNIASLVERDIVLVDASLGTFTANENGGITISNVDVSSYIPSGYTCIGAIPHDSGSYAFHYYLCTMNSPTTVSARLVRMYGNSTTGTTPSVKLICVKGF